MARKSLKSLVDELGTLKAEVADRNERIATIREKLIASGKSEVEGELFRAAITEAEVETFDYPGLVEKLEPSNRILNRFRRITDRVTVRVSAR